MKAIAMLIGVAGFAMSAGVQAESIAVGGTPEQQCARWGDYQGLKGDALNEYTTDCQRELRFPDAPSEDGAD